jgi:RNA polymerase sigma-70 factor (ECF subfamily)
VALASLCETYWYPVYAFIRRSGLDAEGARDLTQGFFARLLDKRDLGGAEPGQGRFRSFLLGAVRHFVTNARDHDRAARRGGGQTVLSIDYRDADRRYALEPVESDTPERLYFRSWAASLVRNATERLRADYAARGQAALFDALGPALLSTDAEPPRRELARQLGMTEDAVNVALHRLRRRFRSRLREEASETLADPGEAEDELRSILALL